MNYNCTENSSSLDLQFPLSEVQLNYKPTRINHRKIKSARSAARLLRQCWSDKIEYVEEVYLLLLNNALHPIGFVKAYQGGTTACAFDPKPLLQAAILGNASRIILAHNHPSGNLEPSSTDIAITAQLRKMSRILNIEVVDHIILAKRGYFSFLNDGIF